MFFIRKDNPDADEPGTRLEIFVVFFDFHNRVARFFLVQNTKTGKTYTKLPQNIPNGHKIFPMAVK
jgi:hypothetical protein